MYSTHAQSLLRTYQNERLEIVSAPQDTMFFYVRHFAIALRAYCNVYTKWENPKIKKSWWNYVQHSLPPSPLWRSWNKKRLLPWGELSQRLPQKLPIDGIFNHPTTCVHVHPFKPLRLRILIDPLILVCTDFWKKEISDFSPPNLVLQFFGLFHINPGLTFILHRIENQQMKVEN